MILEKMGNATLQGQFIYHRAQGVGQMYWLRWDIVSLGIQFFISFVLETIIPDNNSSQSQYCLNVVCKDEMFSTYL